MPDFKTLRVTPLIRSPTAAVYRPTARFPDGERYGLARQMRRAAISIGANVSRSSDGEFARFVHIARGSSHELGFHVLVASDLGMLSREQADQSWGKSARSVECSTRSRRGGSFVQP